MNAKQTSAVVADELIDRLWLVLRNVGNLLDEEARYAAYFRIHPELIGENHVVLSTADQSALSRELEHRLAGYQ